VFLGLVNFIILNLYSSILIPRHLRFIIQSAETLLNKPPTPALLRNQANAADTRLDAVEDDQAFIKKKVLSNSAKIEEMDDGQLNES
jgi:hypothetical protein